MNDDHQNFLADRRQRIAAYAENAALARSADLFLQESLRAQYSYNFEWMGLPIIQYPQDMVALQEIIWRTRPEVIVETGVARGGSLVFYASMLRLLGQPGQVIGIDIDFRPYNRARLDAHPMASDIRILDGSSVDASVVGKVAEITAGRRTMVVLDSNHTHAHVLAELEAYTPLVSPGGYCVVFDTIIETMPQGHYRDRPWDRGNNPWTAVDAFLSSHPEWQVDADIERKLQVSAARNGYLIRT